VTTVKVGTFWDNAFETLQAALTAAEDSDIVFIAKGTYTQSAEYHLFSVNIKIYGSFEGREASPDQRTFASTDTTTLDGSGYRVFSLNNGRNNATVIDGFKITGGHGDDGGGMYSNHSLAKPELYNTIVLGNSDGIDEEGISEYSHCLVQGSGSNFGYTDGMIWDNIPYSPTDVFVSPIALGQSAGGNFHLKLGSPAIDAGDNFHNNKAVDIEGNQRLINGIIDLGAYESAIFPAIIITHPQGENLNVGGNHTMSVVATDTNLTYQWLKNGGAISPNGTAYTYVITNAKSSDAGTYTVKVTADDGSTDTSHPAVVTVATPGGYTGAAMTAHQR